MADRKTTTYRMSSDKEVSSLTKAFKKLSPTKHQYIELSKSSSTSSMSSGSSSASSPYVTITPVSGSAPCSSRYGHSSSKKDESRREKEKEAKEKELLQKLQKSVNDTAKTLEKYVAIRNSKK